MDARYNDGFETSVHAVRIEIAHDALLIAGETANARWPFADIRIIDGGAGDLPLRLGCATAPDARLTIVDGDAIHTLRAALPATALGRMPTRRLAFITAACVGAVALTVLVAFNFVSVVTGLVPISAEARLGTNVRNQIVAMFEMTSKERSPVCASQAGLAIMARLTERLLSGIETPYDFRVEVLRVPMVNAVSLPGGRIIFFNELFAKAANGDEVAGVLAHELAHNLQRHAIQALVRQQGLAMAIGALTGFSGNSLASIGETLVVLSFSRDAESEADLIAGELLMKAGLRTTGLASFFARLGKDNAQKDSKSPGKDWGFAGYFATHPASAERAERAASYGTGGKPALSEAEFAVLQHMCD